MQEFIFRPRHKETWNKSRIISSKLSWSSVAANDSTISLKCLSYRFSVFWLVLLILFLFVLLIDIGKIIGGGGMKRMQFNMFQNFNKNSPLIFLWCWLSVEIHLFVTVWEYNIWLSSFSCQGMKNKEASVALCAASLVLSCEINYFKNQLLVKTFLPFDITLPSAIKMYSGNPEGLRSA